MTDTPSAIYTLDGRRIATAADFFREIGRAVNGSGGYFGRNLDALADCLRGGYGTPDDRPFAFRWQHSEVSKKLLPASDSDQPSFMDAVRAVFREQDVPLVLR